MDLLTEYQISDDDHVDDENQIVDLSTCKTVSLPTSFSVSYFHCLFQVKNIIPISLLYTFYF